MKNPKPWEAQIPQESSRSDGYNSFDYHYWKKIEKTLPNNCVIIKGDNLLDECINWIRKNKITMINWQPTCASRHNGRSVMNYIFRFRTEEDAMAFKLRWL